MTPQAVLCSLTPASTSWLLHTDSNSLALSLGHTAAPWAPAEPLHTGQAPRDSPTGSPHAGALSGPGRAALTNGVHLQLLPQADLLHVVVEVGLGLCLGCRGQSEDAQDSPLVPAGARQHGHARGDHGCPFPSFPFHLTPLPPRIDEQGEAGQHHQQVHVGGLVPGLVHRVVDGPAVAQRRRTASARPPGHCRHGRGWRWGAAVRSERGRREVTWRAAPGAAVGSAASASPPPSWGGGTERRLPSRDHSPRTACFHSCFAVSGSWDRQRWCSEMFSAAAGTANTTRCLLLRCLCPRENACRQTGR